LLARISTGLAGIVLAVIDIGSRCFACTARLSLAAGAAGAALAGRARHGSGWRGATAHTLRPAAL